MPLLQHTPIGVFDSGIGGLSVANAISGLLPRESLLYVADNARAPYGPQSAEAILGYSQEITRFLLSRGAKLIVVACNTATSLAIEALRADFPEVPFVGLEPAVKPAREGKKVGVLATAATLNSPRYQALKAKFLAGKLVLEDACRGLVPIIEAEGPGSQPLRSRLSEILTPMLLQSIDTLVLGCTHYPLVKEDIAAICGPQVNIIDPSQAAARQVVRMLDKHALVAPQGKSLRSPPSITQEDNVTLSNIAPGSGPSTCGPGSSEPVECAYDFYCSGSSVPLQRTLFSLPALNKHQRLVIPNVRYLGK